MIIGIPTLVISCCLLAYIIYTGKMDINLGQYYTNPYQNKISKKEQLDSEAYRILVSSGNYYLNNNYLGFAQEEFRHALELNKYGIEANMSMTKTLIEKCIVLNENCNEAKAYLQYMKSRELKNDNELSILEKKLMSHL